jgi:hypothetical protein
MLRWCKQWVEKYTRVPNSHMMGWKALHTNFYGWMATRYLREDLKSIIITETNKTRREYFNVINTSNCRNLSLV